MQAHAAERRKFARDRRMNMFLSGDDTATMHELADAGICRMTHRTASYKGISVLLSVASPSIAKGGPV
jgi:hypothetical protein